MERARKKFSWKSFRSISESESQNKLIHEKSKLVCWYPAGSMSFFIRGVREEQMNCPCCSFCIAANGATCKCCQLSVLCSTQIKTSYCSFDFFLVSFSHLLTIPFFIPYFFFPFFCDIYWFFFLESFFFVVLLFTIFIFMALLACSFVILWYPA